MDEIKREGEAEFVWPEVNKVGMNAPGRWLKQGWADFCHAIQASIFYGLMFTVMGWALLTYATDAAWELTLMTSFLIVGPFLALGIYDISRRLELGERPHLAPTLTAWRTNAPAVGFYALILALIMSAWIRVALVVIALFFPEGTPTLREILRSVVTSPEGFLFFVAYSAAGLGFAFLVYATSAVSIPMLLDREKMDALSAMIVSFNAVRKSFLPMLLWGLIIGALVTIGFVTWFAGLVVVVPVIGHATWHAYRDLVK